MPEFDQFRTIQSGDPCRVVFNDTTPDLDCNFRLFVDSGNVVMVTSPLGETDPTLQTLHVIETYQSVLTPIPVAP